MSTSTCHEIEPTPDQARKDKQALGLRPSLHQCLLVWKEASEASPELWSQAKLEKTSKQ